MTRHLPHPFALFIDRVRAIARSAHRSGVPSGLSRFASQAKPLLTIAAGDSRRRALAVAAILFACLSIPAIFAGA